MKRNKGMIILFLTPAVLMFSIIFLYPIVRTIVMSFFKIDGITDPVAKWQFTGLSNFVRLANTSLFRISMWNLFHPDPRADHRFHFQGGGHRLCSPDRRRLDAGILAGVYQGDLCPDRLLTEMGI